MGATDFYCVEKGKNAKEAFATAVKDAQFRHGHGGYSGTIAEKSSFVMIAIPAGIAIGDLVNQLMDSEDPRINDKWGPAGCIDLGNGEYYFFGYASE